MRDTVRSQATLDRLIETAPSAALAPRRLWRPRFGLAGRVLILFAGLVMIAEVAVFVTSIVNYRDNWLRNRLSAGFTAALVFEGIPSEALSPEVTRSLLDSVGARIIVLKANGARRILAASDLPPKVDEIYDVQTTSFPAMLAATYRTLFAVDGRVLTVLGEAPQGSEAVELTLDEAPLKRALEHAAQRVVTWSLITSLLAAAFAVAIIHVTMLRPVRRLTTSLTAFANDPENPAHIIVASGRDHEIGHAEAALALMQDTLARELKQKKHLAALGLAVAKINHDMRNMLASAQLLSDRLAGVDDPLAQRLAPKLVATLDRAIGFCQATLTYGRAADPPPQLRAMPLRPVVADAVETTALSGHGLLQIHNAVPDRCEIVGDPDHMFRILINLLRNAAEALDRAGAAPGQEPKITITAQRVGAEVVIEVADTGPGIPPSARTTLFAPFQASQRHGGSGLGLAIAADLARAQAGRLVLASADDDLGTRFHIILPVSKSAR
jgi:signal transduction histidine kinase